MADLLKKKDSVLQKMPALNQNVTGKIVYIGKNEVYVDIDGVITGLIRGRELVDESIEHLSLHIGDEIEATLVEYENEYGLPELSLRHAGHQKAWDQLRAYMNEAKTISVTAVDANKGGLMVKVGGVLGFLPVSQLTSQHYPRVEGGDKAKILEILKGFINTIFDVKVIDLDQATEKLIVSEKVAFEEKQQLDISEFKVDDVIEGKISGIVDFGVFIEFGTGLEGLTHISEMAWHRVDKPADLFKIGDVVGAKIIEIDGAKISLSIKRVTDDPWVTAAKEFTVGEKVKGKVLKVNPFGLFVELNKDIHGLAHISELSDKKIKNIEDIAKAGDEMEFFIISVEPENHRLGLSLKSGKPKKKTVKKDSKAKKGVKQEKEETKKDIDDLKTSEKTETVSE